MTYPGSGMGGGAVNANAPDMWHHAAYPDGPDVIVHSAHPLIDTASVSPRHAQHASAQAHTAGSMSPRPELHASTHLEVRGAQHAVQPTQVVVVNSKADE